MTRHLSSFTIAAMLPFKTVKANDRLGLVLES